ncbi:PPOX class F420-dependent oxidoreductase [Agromyces sp. SYSU T00194]|uniref:PPOX class F420-dependent oxidoreductase n=1 Tax=Agromyces chitinivorans TaxID=3158560 RepID=UPI00339A0C57
MTHPVIPDHLTDLLERPLIASLGTTRPDGRVQVQPMWFEFDGTDIRFTHTTTRIKYRNLMRDPAMTVLVIDPDDTGRYLEVRGRLTEAIPDPTGSYLVHLAARYGQPGAQPPADKADRVILRMTPEHVTHH